jgi:hypothetical protein
LVDLVDLEDLLLAIALRCAGDLVGDLGERAAGFLLVAFLGAILL